LPSAAEQYPCALQSFGHIGASQADPTQPTAQAHTAPVPDTMHVPCDEQRFAQPESSEQSVPPKPLMQ
tara:strand:+ start:813 stop:1016 length:204 start_codon:yes stop_codon:yes gene_type:complete